MEEQKKYGVFISYSHEDAKFIAPIVKLISATRQDLVFQDTKDLAPGKKWEPQLLNALNQAEIIIVFWCKHSANSKYVKQEYERAIFERKDILPVKLDDCSLSADLSKYQWIDFKDVILHSDNNDKQPDHFGFNKVLKIIIPISIILIITIIALFVPLSNKKVPLSNIEDNKLNIPKTFDTISKNKLPKGKWIKTRIGKKRATNKNNENKPKVDDTASQEILDNDSIIVLKDPYNNIDEISKYDSLLKNKSTSSGHTKPNPPKPTDIQIILLVTVLLSIFGFANFLKFQRIRNKLIHNSLNSEEIAAKIKDILNEKIPPL